MIVVDVIGWACAAAVLVAYALVIRTPEAVTGRRYLALNLVGSAGLTASAASHAAWPSAVLNLLWLGLALHASRGRGGSRQSGVVVSATPE
jgi:hypothetical protein